MQFFGRFRGFLKKLGLCLRILFSALSLRFLLLRNEKTQFMTVLSINNQKSLYYALSVYPRHLSTCLLLYFILNP
jgi:hypothetical protein